MERAWQHLESVRVATAFEANDEEVPVYLDPETREYVVRLKIPPIDPMVPLMIGDFAHNARSALDCAIVELGRHTKQNELQDAADSRVTGTKELLEVSGTGAHDSTTKAHEPRPKPS
jgi:hypothetical protein